MLDINDLASELDTLRDEDTERPLDEDDQARFVSLSKLETDLGGDLWTFHDYLIPDDDFVDYIRDQAEECYEIPSAIAHYIDWKAYASDAQCDYTSVEFDGETFWYLA